MPMIFEIFYKIELGFLLSKSTVSTKDIASAQRDTEIAQNRGMSLPEIFAHDLLHHSPLFDGGFPTKPQKSNLILELETHLEQVDYRFQRSLSMKTTIIVDFMSQVRQIPKTNFIY